jgi:sortase A
LAGEDSQASTLSPSREDLGNFSISINKIGIVAPVIRGVDPTNKQKYDQALENGVAHMIGTALPGDGKGNIFIYGHSSAIQKSQYDKIFARLNDLQKKDSILLSYNGTVYYYIVTDKKIVEKTDLSVLAPTDKETLTLMTCWPIGADDKRLIVNAIKK